MSNESTGRRSFLKQVGGVAAAAAAVPVFMEKAEAASTVIVAGPQPIPTRTDVRVGLELDGSFAGWVDSAEGGAPTGEVVTEKLGGDWLQKKHIGNVKYEEVSFKCGTGMSKALYEWIQASFVPGQTPILKNGAVVAVDSDNREQFRLSFANAMLTEITMPALDAASKDAAKMTIKFKPEYTRKQLGAGGGGAGGNFPTGGEKTWSPANFRLKIDGLEEPCARVNKIEALTIKQKVTENPVGEMRDYQKEPASIEVPNLAVDLPSAAAGQFLEWEESFLLRGNNGDDAEKSGSLEYLTPDLQQPLFTVQFKNLGIFKLAPEKIEAGAEGIRRIKAEMYCEDIRFSYSPAASFG
jgi:phage tail-like protein